MGAEVANYMAPILLPASLVVTSLATILVAVEHTQGLGQDTCLAETVEREFVELTTTSIPIIITLIASCNS